MFVRLSEWCAIPKTRNGFDIAKTIRNWLCGVFSLCPAHGTRGTRRLFTAQGNQCWQLGQDTLKQNEKRTSYTAVTNK